MTGKIFNRAGVKAMIHHVTRQYALEPDKLGAVKLHKILWNTEIQLLRRGYDVTGESFIKHDFGPFSEHLDELMNELVAEGLLTVSKPSEEYEVTRFVGKGTADRSALTDDQWRVLEQTRERIVEDHSATSISERSHGFVWEATEMYEPMSPIAEALQWGRKLSRELAEQIVDEARTLT